jgi:hypothetical protein
MSYFSHPFVSNSDLSKLTPKSVDFTDAYRIGSLVDAMITEPEAVDQYSRTLGKYSYTHEEFETCRQMKVSFLKDPFCLGLLRMSTGQKEFYNEWQQFENGITLNTKRKFDLWSTALNWGADIKSTTAKTQAQFEEAARYFDYDRQRYWYMSGAGSAKDLLIGISKVNFRIFKIHITHNDDFFKSGKLKANALVKTYYELQVRDLSL